VHRIIRRPSAAMVVACVALLVALGGTSVAAISQLPRASVGTQQLKRNAVTAVKINPNAVRTGHVLNGTLLAEDFKAGQIPPGPQGAQGPAGPTGPAGPQGRWAHVSGTGAILAQSGGITASRFGPGTYFVTFTGATAIDKPVLASASRASNLAYHFATATPCGGPPQGVGCSASNTTNTARQHARRNGCACRLVRLRDGRAVDAIRRRRHSRRLLPMRPRRSLRPEQRARRRAGRARRP
jgi:hypothetical protein